MKCERKDDEDMEIVKKIGIPVEKYVTNQGV